MVWLSRTCDQEYLRGVCFRRQGYCIGSSVLCDEYNCKAMHRTDGVDQLQPLT